MRKKHSFELSHDEFLEVSGIERVDFNHERNAPTVTGIKAIVKDYIKDDEPIAKSDVVKLLLNGMIEKGFIKETKSWNVQLSPRHAWSFPNDDGDRHSVYTVEVSVYQVEYIFLNDKNNKIIG